MLTFHYKAWNPETQQHVKAIVQADSEQAAASLIRGEGQKIEFYLPGNSVRS
jgi:hypothetical protein